MSRNIGYIVVEYNQASRQPGLGTSPEIHFHREDAEDEKQRLERFTAGVGRKETYTIAAVMVPEEGDDE